jgi:outer membrane protein OmpA-like peptidoglycan-associated protein/tetratricopeptide (TPR) repeat protein
MQQINTILFIILFSFSNIFFAQEMSKYEKDGDIALRELNLEKAIKCYKQAMADSKSPRIIEKLANTITLNGGASSDVMPFYQELYESKTGSPAASLKYAQLLAAAKKYDDAAMIYNSMNDNPSDDINGDYFKNLGKNNQSITIRNVSEINSAYSDFSPIFYKNGIAYVSNSKERDGTGWDSKVSNFKYFTDVYYSEKTVDRAGTLSPGKPLLSKVDADYMQGPMSFSKDFGVMYLTRTNAQKNSVVLGSDNKTANLKIYRVNYKNDVSNWSDVTEVKLNSVSDENNYSYAHPAFGNDDQTLIFASNMPGGYGGTDLWMVKVNGDNWSLPENLGPNVNTAGEEKFPFVAANGDLYFASDGLPGMGGLDIFKSTVESGVYGKPTNIGTPFNSASDDFGYIIDKDEKEGYFTSNRSGGLGSDDIYAWKSNEIKLIVKVVSCKTKLPLKNAEIVIPNLKSGKFITDSMGICAMKMTGNNAMDVSVSKSGYKKNKTNVKILKESKSLTVCLDEEDEPTMKMAFTVIDEATGQPIPDADVTIDQASTQDKVSGKSNASGLLKIGGILPNDVYIISASKGVDQNCRYLGAPVSINTSGMKAPNIIQQNIVVKKVCKGVGVKIDNIYYDVNKWNIRSDAAMELNKIVDLLYAYPTMRIELGSHTDCRGSDEFNRKLSEKRAISAVDYIASKGINPERLSAKGYGESAPVPNNTCNCIKKCTNYEYQQNRRTEFKVLDF